MSNLLCFAFQPQVEAVLGRVCNVPLIWFPRSNSFLKVGEQVVHRFVCKNEQLPRAESQALNEHEASSLLKAFVPVAVRLISGDVWQVQETIVS